MTIGVGGKTKAAALAALSNMTDGIEPISNAEYAQRIASLGQRKQECRRKAFAPAFSIVASLAGHRSADR